MSTANKYSKIDLIGSGTFGKAWLVKCKITEKCYVIKEIKVSGMKDKDRDQALTEVTTLAKCTHKNIISYRDAFVDRKRATLNIVMEYADGGDLHRKIEDQKEALFSEKVILDWFVQISLALRVIHSKNILHRDLKSQNIFLTSSNIIKVGDFGIAKVLQDDQDYAATAIGTPYYLSPEICQHKPYNNKSDMWAAGCVLYEMSSLDLPFKGANFSELVIKILQGRFKPLPRQYSQVLVELVAGLLNSDADKRPAVDEILAMDRLQAYVKRQHLKRKTIKEGTPPSACRTDIPRSKSESCKRVCTKSVSTTGNPSPLLQSKQSPDVVDSFRNNSPQFNIRKVDIRSSPKYSLFADMVKRQKEQTVSTSPSTSQSPSTSDILTPNPSIVDVIRPPRHNLKCDTYVICPMTNLERSENIAAKSLPCDNNNNDDSHPNFELDKTKNEIPRVENARPDPNKITKKPETASSSTSNYTNIGLNKLSFSQMAALMYEYSIRPDSNLSHLHECLCSCLENLIGHNDFVVLYRRVRNGFHEKVPFNELELDSKQIVILPLLLQLIQIENMNIK